MGYVHWGAQSTPRIFSIALAADEAAIQRLLVDARKQLMFVPHQVIFLTEVPKYRWAVDEEIMRGHIDSFRSRGGTSMTFGDTPRTGGQE